MKPTLVTLISLLALLSPRLQADELPPAAPAAGQAAAPSGFVFGSYGRVTASSDGAGGSGKQLAVVAHPPRLEEQSYLELDLSYHAAEPEFGRFRIVTTLAVSDAMFHSDGDFDGKIALRNAFVEGRDLGVDDLSVWVGSRMLRGDDIYLLDFWPLDNLNTVGAGAAWGAAGKTRISGHLGLNQVKNAYQYQELQVADPEFGTDSVILMDRVRLIGSLRAEQPLALGELSAKVVGYGEVHRLGEGIAEDVERVRQLMPSELGTTLGVEASVWGFGERGFANLFVRHATGIAALGELATPTSGLAQDGSVTDTTSTRIATSAGFGAGRFDLIAGAYVDWFSDADKVNYDGDDYYEGTIALRPSYRVAGGYKQAFEFSYQGHRSNGLSARTDTFLVPAILKAAIIPTLAAGTGPFARPELRLIYQVSVLNDGAQEQYPAEDVRRRGAIHHYLGIGAEWWFNSSTYP
jgi:maltoporin